MIQTVKRFDPVIVSYQGTQIDPSRTPTFVGAMEGRCNETGERGVTRLDLDVTAAKLVFPD